MKNKRVWFFLLFCIFFESAFIALPLTLALFVVLYVLYQEEWVLITAFFAGIILDILKLQTIGASSIFFLSFLGIILLYERKFEVKTFLFAGSASLIGSVLYLGIFQHSYILLQGIVSMGFSFILFYSMYQKSVSKKRLLNT